MCAACVNLNEYIGGRGGDEEKREEQAGATAVLRKVTRESVTAEEEGGRGGVRTPTSCLIALAGTKWLGWGGDGRRSGVDVADSAARSLTGVGRSVILQLGAAF